MESEKTSSAQQCSLIRITCDLYSMDEIIFQFFAFLCQHTRLMTFSPTAVRKSFATSNHWTFKKNANRQDVTNKSNCTLPTTIL